MKTDKRTWSPVPAKWTQTGLFLLSGQTFGRIIWKLNLTAQKKFTFCTRLRTFHHSGGLYFTSIHLSTFLSLNLNFLQEKMPFFHKNSSMTQSQHNTLNNSNKTTTQHLKQHYFSYGIFFPQTTIMYLVNQILSSMPQKPMFNCTCTCS